MISHPLEAIKVMSAYPLNVSTLYEGMKIRTTEIPPGYLPKWISIGMPLYILIGFIGALVLLYRWTKSSKHSYYLLLAFAALFPVVYIIYKKSVIYDGMRHIMFVLPLFVVLAALFYDYLLQLFTGKKAIQYAVAGVTLVLVALPARFMFANHPNEYTYFNELAGGIKGAYGEFETDYYFNSMKGALNWLIENRLKQEAAGRGKDTIIIASNAPATFLEYQKISPVPFKFVYVRYYQRNETNWDYGVFMSRFLDKEQLQNGYFPGDNPIHIESADGVPLTTVLQNDPERKAMKGYEALKQGQDTVAVALLAKAVQQYPKDAETWRNLAIAYLQTGNKAGAEEAVAKAYAISSLDLENASTAGGIYMQTGDFNKALQVFGKMTQDYPQAGEGWLGLGQAYAGLKNYPLAIDNLNKALALDGNVAPQAYMAMAYIYQQQGDMATAQKYAAAAQQAQQAGAR